MNFRYPLEKKFSNLKNLGMGNCKCLRLERYNSAALFQSCWLHSDIKKSGILEHVPYTNNGHKREVL